MSLPKKDQTLRSSSREATLAAARLPKDSIANLEGHVAAV